MADFLCDDAMLIVEVDGSQHADAMESDAARTRYLESLGYFVLRFWNGEVKTNIEGVLDTIYGHAADRRKAPSSALRAPSPQGEKDDSSTDGRDE